MKEKEIINIAEGLLKLHKLGGWTFGFDGAKTRLGYCDYNKKRISVSYYHASVRELDETKDTILHEIAHALSLTHYGLSGKGHGRIWKHYALMIGAKPKRCGSSTAKIEHKYIYKCPTNCGNVLKRHRKIAKTKRIACGACCRIHNGGKYDDRFRFELPE